MSIGTDFFVGQSTAILNNCATDLAKGIFGNTKIITNYCNFSLSMLLLHLLIESKCFSDEPDNKRVSRMEIFELGIDLLSVPFEDKLFETPHIDRFDYRPICPTRVIFVRLLEDCGDDERFKCEQTGLISKECIGIYRELYNRQCTMKYVIEKQPKSGFYSEVSIAFSLLAEFDTISDFYMDLDYFKFVYTSIKDVHWGFEFWNYALHNYNHKLQTAPEIKKKAVGWMRTKLSEDLSSFTISELIKFAYTTRGSLKFNVVSFLPPIYLNQIPRNLITDRLYEVELLSYLIEAINKKQTDSVDKLESSLISIFFNLVSKFGKTGLSLMDMVKNEKLLKDLKVLRRSTCYICTETYENHKNGFYFKLPCGHESHHHCASAIPDTHDSESKFNCPLCRRTFDSIDLYPGEIPKKREIRRFMTDDPTSEPATRRQRIE